MIAIVNDRDNQRVVDTETGEYMTWRLADWQSQTSYFALHNKQDKGLLGAEVSASGRYDDGKKSKATLRFSLNKIWIPTGNPEPPRYFYDQHELINRLSDFLEVYRHYSGIKNPDPRFEFVDARKDQGDHK